jgi:hypothetical protein
MILLGFKYEQRIRGSLCGGLQKLSLSFREGYLEERG